MGRERNKSSAKETALDPVQQKENTSVENGSAAAGNEVSARRFRILRWGFRWGFRSFLAVIALLLLGLIPVNNDFVPAESGIEIYVISNEVHADLVLPVRSDVYDWSKFFPESDFAGKVRDAKYVVMGWGDQGFFINTPRWSDLTVSTAANALLWPSSSCLHVQFSSYQNWSTKGHAVKLSPQQYQRLVEFLQSSFARELPAPAQTGAGSLSRIPNAAYGQMDAFYQAVGRYHAFNTCNSWMGRALQTAGVRVGWFTPLPKTVYLYLPPQ